MPQNADKCCFNKAYVEGIGYLGLLFELGEGRRDEYNTPVLRGFVMSVSMD